MTDDVCTDPTCEHYGKPDGGIHRTEFANDRPSHHRVPSAPVQALILDETLYSQNPYRVPSAAVRRAWRETVAWEDLRNREYPVDTTETRKGVR